MECTGKSQGILISLDSFVLRTLVIITLPEGGYVRREIHQLHQNCEETKDPNSSYLVINIVKAEENSSPLPRKPYILEFQIVAGRAAFVEIQ